MKEETIALRFENNELAAISEAISECKKFLTLQGTWINVNKVDTKRADT